MNSHIPLFIITMYSISLKTLHLTICNETFIVVQIHEHCWLYKVVSNVNFAGISQLYVIFTEALEISVHCVVYNIPVNIDLGCRL